MTYDLLGDGSTILRTGFAITYFPEQPSASNMIGQQVPYTISQNVNFPTNPTDFATVRKIDDPFPAIAQVKPRTTAELQAANPRVLGHSFENETPYAEQWHLGVDRQLFGADGARVRLRRQRRQAHRLLLQPERGAAGHRDAGVAPADPAAQPVEQHAAVRSAQPLDLSQRAAEGHAAVPRTACNCSAATPTARRSTTAGRRRAAAARSATRRP